MGLEIPSKGQKLGSKSAGSRGGEKETGIGMTYERNSLDEGSSSPGRGEKSSDP